MKNFLQNMKSLIKDVITTKLGEKFDPETLYFISVQGPTGSGKTTFSSILNIILKKFKLLPLLIHIDSFYQFVDNSLRDQSEFDYDNPKTIRWDAIDKAINSILKGEDKITLYERSQSVSEQIIDMPNKGYNIIILEGIYALNCLGKKKFNLDEFDPYHSIKEYKQEFIDNQMYSLLKDLSVSTDPGRKWKSIKFLNIRFLLCEERLKYIRLRRDKKTRNLELGEVLPRLDKFIIPATSRWVYSKEFESDIEVQHGNYNETVKKLLESLYDFFEVEDLDYQFPHDLNLSDSKSFKCTGLCEQIDSNSLYLPDSIANPEKGILLEDAITKLESLSLLEYTAQRSLETREN